MGLKEHFFHLKSCSKSHPQCLPISLGSGKFTIPSLGVVLKFAAKKKVCGQQKQQIRFYSLMGYTAPLSAPISLVRVFSSPSSRFIFASARLILSPSSNSPLSSRCRIQSRKSSSVQTIPNQIGSCVPFLEVGDEGLASGEVSGDEEDEVLDLSRILEMEMLG